MTNDTTIRILLVSFNLPLYTRQIPQWRGAFLEMAGLADDLLHNHNNQAAAPAMWTEQEETETVLTEPVARRTDAPLHYRYPVVQYRVYKGNAAVFLLNDGIETIQKTFAQQVWQINWQGNPRPILINDFQANQYQLSMLTRPRTYQLYRWLALQGENYQRWEQCQGLAERIQLLERILTGNLITFAKGMGWTVPAPIELRIQLLQQTQFVYYHGKKMLAFNLSYQANVSLPPLIALGKGVSHGFGWQVPARKKERDERLEF